MQKTTTQLHHAAFPPLLKQIPDAPTKLHLLGQPFSSDKSYIAIVGTRRASHYGLKTAEEIAFCLARQGFAVVSGLALGIDAAAHEGALAANGVTVAVLGTGINNITPHSNRPLAKRIAQTGTILSEYDSDSTPHKGQFPKRNRIIAGMSRATIVIEAPQKSGALITARLAVEYNREVFAVPGQIGFDVCSGSNQLLRSGARIITNIKDLLEDLGVHQSLPQTIQPTLLLSEEESAIINTLKHESIARDALGIKLKMPPQKLTATLTLLELKGLITTVGNQIYRER